MDQAETYRKANVAVGPYADLCEAVTGFPLNQVVVIDLETTGLYPWDGDEILSVAICDGYGKELYSSLIKPTRHSSWPEAERINGISPKMVAHAPTIAQASYDIQEHLLGNHLVVGYNLSFDLQFLKEQGVIESWPMSRFDVMYEYARVHGSKRSEYDNDMYAYSKLETCAKHYGYDFQPHDALNDVEATAFCFRALLCDRQYIELFAEEKSEGLGRLTMNQLKATTETVLRLVDEGMVRPEPAELRIGMITQGKNKGKPRYECYIGEERVGVSSGYDVDSVKALFMLSDHDGLPEVIPCAATLSASGKTARCDVKLTDTGRYRQTLMDAAASVSAQAGILWNALPQVGSKHSKANNQYQAGGKPEHAGEYSPNPVQATSSKSENKKSVPKIIIGAFFIFSAIYGLFQPTSDSVLTTILSVLVLLLLGGFLLARGLGIKRKVR